MGFNDDLDSPSGGTATLERVDTDTTTDTPWSTILHNDPVNLVDYVTRVLVKVLEVDTPTAERFMMTAHLEGKVAVYNGERDKCEQIANQLMAHTLWATLEKAGS